MNPVAKTNAQPTQEEQIAALLAERAKILAENEALKKARTGKISMKIGEKGGIVFSGFGRFPITMYKDQYLRLDAAREEIHTFIKANDDKLKVK